MKLLLLALGLSFATLELAHAQAQLPDAAAATPTREEQELLTLSKTKWTWMANKNVDALGKLFTDKCVFVHMGGSWGKSQELSTIKDGMIWYKQATVYGAAVNFFNSTAILLNDLDLVAVVGGREVVNPFMVTEVYVKENDQWKLGSLTFSHLARPVKLAGGATPPAAH